MGSSKKTAQNQPDVVARLTAQVEALTARLDMLEGSPRHSENGNGQNKAPQSRRDLLKLPGFAPIQGVGGVTTIAVTGGTVQVSEGINGYGAGATGIGVTGESDVGYGIAGGSGGIDVAALGSGRVLQLALIDSLLTSPPSGPPNYTPNDFEQVRDGKGIIWVSKLGGGWRRLNSVIPVTPFRIFDSRPNAKPKNSTTDITIAGVGGIPADAIGVFGNLTALTPAADG